MNAKHTPGPWKVAMHETAYRAIESDGAGVFPLPVVCLITSKGIDAKQDIANAFLIAAAPALLSALEEVELSATQARLASTIGKQTGVKQANFLRRELDRIGQAARAAIEKAQEMKTP